MSAFNKVYSQVNWGLLSLNPAAIHLLEQNLDKVDWSWLSRNPAAIHLLERHQDKIDWYIIAKNPSIFEEDYRTLCKKRSDLLREELMARTWHPKRFREWCLDTDEIREISF